KCKVISAKCRMRRRAPDRPNHFALLSANFAFYISPARLPGRFSASALAWGFMLPALVSVAVWAYWPLAQGAVMAFYDWHILAPKRFIGLDNFVEAFSQPMFYKTLGNAFFYVGLTLALGFFAPVVLALMLTEIPRGTLLFRTLYYLPS